MRDAPKLAVIQNEEQARVCGRIFAMQVFKATEWKLVGKQPHDEVLLYEAVCRESKTVSVRAVRSIRATLAEMEGILSSSYRYDLLQHVLPDSFYKGGSIVDYRHVEHTTSEREHVNIQYASFRPYTSAPGIENHLLLEYTLSTRLQRSRRSDNVGNEAESSKSIPSLIHLLRPVDFPVFGAQRREYQRTCLSKNDLSITYVVQQTEQPEVLTLEVILTSTLDPGHTRRGVGARDQHANQQVILLRDALFLTRVDTAPRRHHGVRPYNLSPSSRTSTPYSREVPVRTVASVIVHSGCHICKKRFNAFRWKHHCEVCDQAVCNHCLSSIANPAAGRKKRVCNSCLYGNARNGARATPSVHPEKSRHVRASSTTLLETESANDDNQSDHIPRVRRAQTVTTPEVQSRNSKPNIDLLPQRSSYSIGDNAAVPGLRSKFQQLKTPIPDYDLNFEWLHTFPKAPVPEQEHERLEYLDHLCINSDTSLFLRNDEMLEQLACHALEQSSQWDHCTINVVDDCLVYLLAQACKSDDNQQSNPQDTIPREQSASAYAIYYKAPFFVADLASDDRFRAHPLVTENEAVSLLSFPIFSSTGRKCIGTLDLWRSGCQQMASSHVSSEWLTNLDFIIMEIGLRIEELAKENQSFYPSGFHKPRTGSRACSTDSSCDSHTSTKRDDSIELDFVDLDDVEDTPTPLAEEDEERIDEGIGGKESIHERISTMDLHSTIESLLHQAHKTSTMMNQHVHHI